MLYNLISNLVDSTRRDETALPSLKDVIGLKRGEVTLTVDPTLRKPVRIKPFGFTAYSNSAQLDVEDAMRVLNACLAPFTIHFLKANVSADRPSWPTDLATCVSALHLMYVGAQKGAELAGHKILVELSISLSVGPNSKLRQSASCTLVGPEGQSRTNSRAIAAYRAVVESLWSRVVKNSLGNWIRENDIREFRLRGEVPLSQRQAGTAGRQPLPGSTASAA